MIKWICRIENYLVLSTCWHACPYTPGCSLKVFSSSVPAHFTGDSHASLESSLHRAARAYLLGPRSCHFNRANDLSGELLQVVLARRSARFHHFHGHDVPAVYEQRRPCLLKKSIAGTSGGEVEKDVLRPQ